MDNGVGFFQYSQEQKSLIDSKIKSSDFSFKSWAMDDFEGIRCDIRNYYRKLQGGVCAYCRNPVSLYDAMNCHVEHVAPKSKYVVFMFEPRNLCVICADCNKIKRDQEVLCQEPDTISRGGSRKLYPKASSAFYIVHPHYDNWDEHILIVGKYYVDKTKKGHFTIGACVLNRHLREFGWELPIVNDVDMQAAMCAYMGSSDTTQRAAALLRLKKLMQQL